MPSLFTLMPRLVRLLMSDEFVYLSVEVVVLVVSRRFDVIESAPAEPLVPEVNEIDQPPLLASIGVAVTPSLAALMAPARPASVAGDDGTGIVVAAPLPT